MKKRLIFLSLIVVALVSFGCAKIREVKITDLSLKRFELLSTSAAIMEIQYNVDNPSGRTFILSAADGMLKKNGLNFAQATLMQADTVSARGVTVGVIKFKIDVLDPLALLSMGLNLSKWDYKDLKVDARATIKSPGRGKRVIKYKDIPVENLAKRL